LKGPAPTTSYVAAGITPCSNNHTLNHDGADFDNPGFTTALNLRYRIAWSPAVEGFRILMRHALA
jgi:hypothetical protein